LNQVSSHGVFVIASGAPGGRGQTTAAMMTNAMNWVTSDATKAKYPFLDVSRLAVAGQSCGGVEAYNVASDKRITAIGIFNSGLMTPAESQRIAPTVTQPIFYFLGGSTDIAYANVSVKSSCKVWDPS
jgi:dienelactone hydrolase